MLTSQFFFTGWSLAQANLSNRVFEYQVEDPTFFFSISKLILALIAGVVMALAFQLLFTNLAIALITSPSSPADADDEANNLGDAVKGIETKVGFGLLISASAALFAAAFLAVTLSSVGSTTVGVIAGIVIWAIFFTLLVWFSSTALGSLLGAVINTATTGIKGLLGKATSVIEANVVKNQTVSTAEDIAAAVRREITSGIDIDNAKNTVQSVLNNLQVPELDIEQIGDKFEKLLKDSDLAALSNSDFLESVDRKSLIKLVSSRTDLSKKDINQITDQLERVWKKVFGKKGSIDPQELVEQLKSTPLQELKSGELSDKLGQLVQTFSDQPSTGSKLATEALEFGTTAVLSRALKSADFSDIDVEKIAGKLQTLAQGLIQPNGQSNGQPNGQLNGQSNGQSSKNHAQRIVKPFSVIQADLENYLLFSPPWELSKAIVKHEFQDVIYDAEANPHLVQKELEVINRDYFVQLLSMRTDFTPQGVEELADYLEEIRSEVFDNLQPIEDQNVSGDLRYNVEEYLRSTDKAQLNSEKTEGDFRTLLEDDSADWDSLKNHLNSLDRVGLEQLLKQRQDISDDETGQIINQLIGVRDQVLSEAEALQNQVQDEAKELRQKVEDYLRGTNKDELNPEGIQRDLKKLFDDPKAGIRALQGRLSQFDRDTLVQLLSQRQDLTEDQVNQILDQIESIRDDILNAPKKLVNKAQEQYEQTMQAISDYLRNTKLEELNPEGIQRDLQTLVKDPKAGVSALGERLTQVDRDTLVQLLSQRNDLTEEQVEQTIDQVQAAIRNLIKAPRRLASRVKEQTVAFETNLERYLKNTNKDELNPEGIKRDLKLLLKDPGSGLSNLSDRVSQFDRETLVSLLMQREDINEEEANRIANQVESAYKSIVEQVQQIQQTVQSTIDKSLDSIRRYLNELERPELNYDGIKQDLGKLFDDPQIGLEALKSRLSQFDRETLVAVLSSREDITEADANRIIDQIESTRDNVLHQIERVQLETKKRLDAIKFQTEKQVQETRKIAAGAAWWVFSSALFSLAASAVAGFLAVDRIVSL